MGARKRLVVPAWIGMLLIVIGFLSFVGSFFLLPVYVTALNCFDYCTPPKYATAWEFSLHALSDLISRQVAPIYDTFALLLLNLPLLAAVGIVGSSLGFFVHPTRMLAIWLHRGWLTGTITLLLLLPILLFFIRPDIGYLGMLAGYALLWGGNRVFLAAHPEARYDP